MEKGLKNTQNINWLPWRDAFKTSCIENYHNLERLARLMNAVYEYRVPPPHSTHESTGLFHLSLPQPLLCYLAVL